MENPTQSCWMSGIGLKSFQIFAEAAKSLEASLKIEWGSYQLCIPA